MVLVGFEFLHFGFVRLGKGLVAFSRVKIWFNKIKSLWYGFSSGMYSLVGTGKGMVGFGRVWKLIMKKEKQFCLV